MASGGDDSHINEENEDLKLVEEEQKIVDETTEVFGCYVESCLEQEEDPSTPRLPLEQMETKVDKTSRFWDLGQKLAKVSKKLETPQNKNLFKNIVDMVNVGNNEQDTFSEFQDIARRVTSRGITWQNITTLFLFGYYIARDRLVHQTSHNVKQFFKKLLSWIVDIFKHFGIIRWIASQGGWNSFQVDDLEGFQLNASYVFAGISVLAAVSVTLFFFFRNRNQGPN